MRTITATILALLVLLPFASAAVNVGTGSPPAEAERASSVQVFSFGENAMICVNCPALTTEPEPGLMQATNAERFPRIVCKGDTPCVIYTGLKYSGTYTANPASENQPYAIVTKDGYQKGKPITKGSLNFALEDRQVAVDAETNKMYDIENPHIIILQNAKAYIDNAPAVAEEQNGQILKIRGLDKRAPNQLIGEMSIPLKKGDTLTFKGIFGDKEYSLEQPVLAIGKFTDNEDDSTAEDEDAEDWLDELNDKFLDSGKDRSELKICGKKFANYYAGSAFELEANEGRCEITEYLLNTELFEEDDAEDNKLFAYSCGDIVFEAVGGNAKNLYCDQRNIHNAVLSCGKDGNDPVCTGMQGKAKFKVKIEPGAFDIDNTQGYMFQSVREVASGEQKAYHFLTGGLKIRTNPQSETPGRYEIIGWPAATGDVSGTAPDGKSDAEKEVVVTYKDNAAAGVNTIWLANDRKISRVRGNQIFSYRLLSSAYKAVLGEGMHQINLIYPEALEVSGSNMIKIKEATRRGATRDNIGLLGATAEERIDLSRAFMHEYLVTPLRPGQQESAVEAVTSTPSLAFGEGTTLGEYAYRYCWGRETPSPLTGNARDATMGIARQMLERNPQLNADANDILNTPVPAGEVLEAPETVTTYRIEGSVVNVRLAPQGCRVLLAEPAIAGEQCMDKPGAVVKCVPASRQSQCANVYAPGEGVKECVEGGVCCEVRLTQADDYCVIPEQGAFLASGAKCKARCRSEVTPSDYGKIDVERVGHCAEGLECCKSARSSSSTAGATLRDDSACTSIGGTCEDTRSYQCFDTGTGAEKGFVAGKCHSIRRAPWYQCCPGMLISTAITSVAMPEAEAPAAENGEEAETARVPPCDGTNGQCKATCDEATEREASAFNTYCNGKKCCTPK